MSVEWDSLPLLPLRCILDHLSVENALAAMSTCRHWRQAMLLYEGRRFFDAIKLQEVVFIGPIYIQQSPLVPLAKLKRIITESLVFKHSHFMQKLAIMGCEMGSDISEKDRFVHKQVEYYSKPLSFTCVTSPGDAVLSRCNVNMMMFSTLKHIIFEYDLATTEALETLSQLNNLTQLSLNVVFKRQMALPVVDWHRVNARFGKGLDVAVNIINLPHRRFKAVMDNLFTEGMSLTSLKAMFCKTIYIRLVSHVCVLYKNTLREFVWVDCPQDGNESNRAIKTRIDNIQWYNEVNTFILLCWRCRNLRRLVVHGYWIWKYDLLGFVRLNKSLQMEISSLYAKQDRFGPQQDGDCVLRVMQYDTPPTVHDTYIQEINSIADHGWQPVTWRQLPAGLRARSSVEDRANYIVREVLRPLDVT